MLYNQQTTETHHASFLVERNSESTRFTLSRRQLEWGRYIGLSLALPSLIFAALLFAPMCTQTAEAVRIFKDAPWLGAASFGIASMLSLMFLLTIGTCFVGLMILADRTRNVIVVNREGIHDYLMFGPLWRKRRVPLEACTQLSVSECPSSRFVFGGDSIREHPLNMRPFLGTYDHELHLSGEARRWHVASYYPAIILDEFLPQVKIAIENARSATKPTAAPLGPRQDSSFRRGDDHNRETIVARSSQDTFNLPSAEGKCENTYITDHETDSGTIYEISRVGFFKGSKGLGLFSIVFSTFWFGMSIFLLTAVINIPQFSLLQLGVTCFLGIFILAGSPPVVVALNMGFQKALIAVTDEQVTIRRKSLLRTRQISIPKKSIFQIRVGFSGASVNHRRHREIQIMSSDGVRHGLLSQLPDAELYWLADDLARRIGLHSTTENGVFATDALTGKRRIDWAGVPSLPSNSAMQVQPYRDGFRIAIPPLGLFRASPYILLDLVLVIAGCVMIAWNGFLPLPVIVMGIVFIVGGLAGLVVVFYFYSEHIEITARAEELIVVKKRPWNQKSYCWKSAEVKSVDCVDSGFGRDSNPERSTYFQLFVVAHDSHRARHGSPSRLKLLFSRTPADIAYVAAVINSILRKTSVNE